MSPIPAHIQAAILPSPTASVAEFLRFPFPSQLPMSSIKQDVHDFWSLEPPNVSKFTAESLKRLPIPSAAGLSALQEARTPIQEKASILYAHLPNNIQSRYPPWILTYWILVSSLREHAKAPWMQAESFLSTNKTKWHSGEFRTLCQSVQNSLLCLPWAGDVRGFSENSPTVLLASYLSHNWLSTSHINQQLDLLRHELLRIGKQQYEILQTDFFTKIGLLHRDRKENNYPAGFKNRHILGVADDLANSTIRGICGVANVNGNHWVAITVDVVDRQIRYGDSLDGLGTELKAAIQWWIKIHISMDLEETSLDITKQTDGFNCGLFALNAVEHFVHPEKHSLLVSLSSSCDEDRLSRFITTCDRDLEMVS